MTNSTKFSSVDRERIRAAQHMLTAFFVLAKTAGVYETTNDSYRSQLARFCNLLQTYMEDNHSCTIKVVNDRFFVDEHFVSIDGGEQIGLGSMIARWNELGIGGLVIGDSVQPDHFTALIELFRTFSPATGDPCELFNDALADKDIDAISVLAKKTADDEPQVDIEDRQRIRQEARHSFFRAITTVKDVMTAASQEETISVARTKRVVHTIIDQISEDESALLELASIKDFDEYTYAHCVNVSIYSLALGFRLGLSRPELSELGFAALFHDIGKIRLPRDLITKEDRFDDFDWVQMHRHPVLGAMTIATSLRLDTHAARAMAAAFEHHMNPDNTGYPTLPERRPTNLYSRIIAIADNFDALTSGRVYIKRPIPADEVLRKLMYQMSVKFDTFLLKLFVAIIGIYPIGSLVLLSDNSLGIVTRNNRVAMDRPKLRIIAEGNGPINPPIWRDLADDGNRGIDILHIIDPDQHNIDMTAYILSD